jgi:hypothetical protein
VKQSLPSLFIPHPSALILAVERRFLEGRTESAMDGRARFARMNRGATFLESIKPVPNNQMAVNPHQSGHQGEWTFIPRDVCLGRWET